MAEKRRAGVNPVKPKSAFSERMYVKDRIGEGGMSVIEEGFDRNLLRHCALKKILPDKRNSSYSTKHLIEEAQITAQLDHPNIVPVYELGVDDDDTLYFTMKRVEGRTLTEILEERSGKETTGREMFDFIQIFLKICDAVAFAHNLGVIHRDLKPDNIMAGDFGEVYLMDWGIAMLKKEYNKPSKADLDPLILNFNSDEGVIAGSPWYMAPEMATGRLNLIDERSDIFALGAILYESLSGRTIFEEGRSIDELLAKVKNCRIVSIVDSTDFYIPPYLARITMKALSKEPDERYQSVSELKLDLEHFLQSGWQFEKRHYPTGSLIVNEGDSADEAFIITRGQCKVFRTIDSRKVLLREMEKGEVFGETAVFMDRPRTASVQAVDDVTVAVVDRRQFEDGLGTGFWMGLFVKTLAERFIEKDDLAVKQAFMLADNKLALETMKHMAFSGKYDSAGRLEAKWSGILPELTTDLKKSEKNILAAIGRMKMFEIDEAHDTIRFKKV